MHYEKAHNSRHNSPKAGHLRLDHFDRCLSVVLFAVVNMMGVPQKILSQIIRNKLLSFSLGQTQPAFADRAKPVDCSFGHGCR